MNIDKVIEKLDEDTIEEMDRMGKEDLRKTIVQAEMSIKETKEELEVNREFQKARDSVKILSSGFREVKQRQGAKISYALHRLVEMGQGA